MDINSIIKTWFLQVRGPFLILSVVLVLLGMALAYQSGVIHWMHGTLLMIGVLMTHISVNLFNEYSDFKTKIDTFTHRTPFSGGSGLLQAGNTSPKAVLMTAYIMFFLSAVIGFYFIWVSGWMIAIFMIIGGLSIRFYTSHLAKWLLGEFFAGLALGTFVVLGVYYALTGYLTLNAVLISIPPGILTFLLLFLNEFPDAEADQKGGRHHLVIHFGKKKASRIYIGAMLLVYVIILAAPFICAIPFLVWIALLTSPLAVKSISIVVKHVDDTPQLIPALGMNVGVVILTDLLLAAGYFLSA
ncbi:prenyltransferase [bacterium]|nr:prenyltransferase [bacterium]RQV93758.1 MAG: prenyltransferase [bacterium]